MPLPLRCEKRSSRNISPWIQPEIEYFRLLHGKVSWELVAFYLNQQTDLANEEGFLRLLKSTQPGRPRENGKMVNLVGSSMRLKVLSGYGSFNFFHRTSLYANIVLVRI